MRIWPERLLLMTETRFTAGTVQSTEIERGYRVFSSVLTLTFIWELSEVNCLFPRASWVSTWSQNQLIYTRFLSFNLILKVMIQNVSPCTGEASENKGSFITPVWKKVVISVFQNKIPEIPLQDQVRNYKMLVLHWTGNIQTSCWKEIPKCNFKQLRWCFFVCLFLVFGF